MIKFKEILRENANRLTLYRAGSLDVKNSFWSDVKEHAEMFTSFARTEFHTALVSPNAKVLDLPGSPSKKVINDMKGRADILKFKSWDEDSNEYVVLNPKVLSYKIQEQDDSKYQKDIDKIVSILNTALNDKTWNDGMSFNFKANQKDIKEFVETQISPYNYMQSVKEGLIKSMLDTLRSIEKSHMLPTKYTNKRTMYYDVRIYPKWQEISEEMGQIFRQHLDRTDADFIHPELMLNEELEFKDDLDAAIYKKTHYTEGSYSKSYINSVVKIGQMFRKMFEEQDNSLTIWRVIFVDAAKHIRLNRNIGISWTFNENNIRNLISMFSKIQSIKASLTGKSKSKIFVLRGQISMNDVNWFDTLVNYSLFTRSISSRQQKEYELTLKKGVVPKNIDVTEWNSTKKK